MALTQVSTGGIKNATITEDDIATDAITHTKIATNALRGTDMSAQTITGDKISNATIGGGKIADNAISSSKILAQSITNAKVHPTAAIAGTKISPNFGSQSVQSANINLISGTPTITFESTSNPDFMIQNQSGKLIFQDTTSTANRLVINTNGHVDVNSDLDVTGELEVTGHSYLENATLTASTPSLNFISSSANPDYMIQNQSGKWIFRDTTNSVDRLAINTDGHVDIAGNLDVGAGLDVTGSVAVSGTSDGVLNLDTSDSRGAFVRFGQGGSFHNMVGCADGLTSGDKEDLGVRAADNIIFAAGGSSEKMRITSGGNVGIGNQNPGSKLSVGGNITLSASHPKIVFNAGGSRITNNNISNTLSFFSDTSNERMRIRSNGNVMIGNSSHFSSNVAKLDVVHAGANTAPTYVTRFFQETNNTGSDHACIQLRHAAATGTQDATMIDFKNSGGHTHGSIKMDGSSVSFNSTSDYRIKENLVSLSNAITRLKTLKPYRFNYKDNPTKTVDGFLAHEVTAVPEAVTGTKDEVDSDNNPIYQGIDQSKLVPLIVAAVQELIGKVEVLEAA